MLSSSGAPLTRRSTERDMRPPRKRRAPGRARGRRSSARDSSACIVLPANTVTGSPGRSGSSKVATIATPGPSKTRSTQRTSPSAPSSTPVDAKSSFTPGSLMLPITTRGFCGDPPKESTLVRLIPSTPHQRKRERSARAPTAPGGETSSKVSLCASPRCMEAAFADP